MNKKFLICFLIICTMLIQLLPVSMAAETETVDFGNIATISNICIMEDNKLTDGTAINPIEHYIYLKGGFRNGCQHVASRTFTLSNIVDTDLIGCDLIGYGHDTYKDDTPVRKYFKTNHDVNGTPKLLNWINFTVEFDADVYVYTLLGKGGQPDNDRALEAAGFTFVSTNSNGYMKSSVPVNNCIFKGKWKKSVGAGTRVSLPSYRGGSSVGSIMPVVIVDYKLKELSWPAVSSHGRDMPFTPPDKYVSQQNPPTYKWKYVSNAKFYELQISTDREFTNVVKKYENINTNYFSAPDTLAPGETYYWRVRYFTGSGVSHWTEARRFRVSPDAYEYTFPGVEEVLKRVPKSHPRILTTPENADEFRALKDTKPVAKRVADYWIGQANGYISEYAKGEEGMFSMKEPVFEDAGDDLSYLGKYRNEAQRLTEHMYRTAFVYLLTGDEKYSTLAKEMLLSLSSWCMKDDGNGNMVYDPNGHSSYTNQDQVHRYITYRSAMAYDWLYDALSESERKTVRNMISERTKVMAHLLSNLKANPYDSHGWTAFGFIGIIAVATYGEIPEAESWLRTIIPAYSAMLPPWGYQDGGWSQGTDYWQYSTCDAQEFMDVLAQAEILDLYKTAYIQNEYLWTLYAYPAGSYGSFGDQSNRALTGYYAVQSLTNEIYYNGNPTAKWVLESLGGTTSNVIDNYYTGNIESLESCEPEEYPLSHEFNDIGWVVMTNDLMNEDRIQMTFKSSPYGSFNHSHPDQNAFIIQAFGENLANKSGYYDWYHSDHDNHITRPTFSHNTITVDGGKGQRDDDFTAKGQMLQFVTHQSFDSATGDATDAYKGNTGLTSSNYYKGNGALDKFVRDIIYVRPGVFVVIDDLDAAGNDSSVFEWWLNAEHTIEYTDNSALIKENDARLKADIHYPENVSSDYYDGFISPFDGKYYKPQAGYVNANEQRKVCFKTARVPRTKIVSTMSVYKADEEATVIDSFVSSDGSYMTLDFADGTRCLVNLGDDTATVSDGVVTFTGDAVTYNAESIMLTNGTYLRYNDRELISSSRFATVVMGGGNLGISVTGDSNDYTDNSMVIANNTGYLNVSSINDLKDLEGRVPSYEIGLPQTYVTEDSIQLYPFEGNYSLSIDGMVINPISLRPIGVAINNITKENFMVSWDEKANVLYDIVVNDIVYEDVSSPYTVEISDDEKAYDIALRGRKGYVVSSWSDGVYYSPGSKNSISHVRYTCTDGVVSAEVFARNPGKEELVFYLAEYKADGNLSEINTGYITDKYTKVSLPYNETSTYKAMVWVDGITPVKASADYNSFGTDLRCILSDGVAIEGYSNSKDEYTISVPADKYAYPIVTPLPMDSTTKVSVSNCYADGCAMIIITSPKGEKRTVKVNFVPEHTNIHVVTGATAETDFKYDTGRSASNGVREGKVSGTNVVTLTYDLFKNGVETKKVIGLPVYTNLHPSYSPNTFGSRVTSDREPNSGNFTEFNDPADGFIGYDHILFPNNDFFAMQGTNVGSAVKNAKVEFDLSQPAEVYVLTTDNVLTRNIMSSQGFEFDATQPVSRGRYMDTIGVEDIYYNVNILGKDKNQIGNYSLTSTNGVRFKSYAYAPDWVDVKPISGCSTVQSYIDAGYKKNDFTVVGSCEARIVKGTYVYDGVYVKRYEDITDPTDITIDFGSFPAEANRMILVVRPLTPKTPISNFKYLGPTTFDSLNTYYKVGCTDNYDSKLTYETAYSSNPCITVFSDGINAYADNSAFKIGNIDPMLELEGAYVIPPLYNLTGTGENTAWMRAYYYGLDEYKGYHYPSYPKTAMPMYSFELEKPADLYVITSGFKPVFMDSTWQRIVLDKPAFTVSDNKFTYTEMYVKHIEVQEGSPVKVTMPTVNSKDVRAGLYYTFVKPTE